MQLQTILYSDYIESVPQQGRFVIGQQQEDQIIMYQAFNDRIADYAVAHQQFGGPDYRFSRMTWIKPGFLWMMYRSGWAQKEDQNRILAIEMSMHGFLSFLESGAFSTCNKYYPDKISWQRALKHSDVRIQWDPDHSPHGGKLLRSAVQIGLKDEALQRFNGEYIRSITDITGFVHQQKALLEANDPSFSVMRESVIEVGASLKSKHRITLPGNYLEDIS